MKPVITLILAIMYAFTLNAVIRTVDNNSPSIGQYSTFAAAFNASSNGDTIYVYPSAIEYLTSNLTKQLTIVGAGFDPANPLMVTSKISPYTNSIGSPNCKFIGLDFLQGTTLYQTTSIQNCRFNAYLSMLGANSVLEDCQFNNNVYIGNGTLAATNITFYGCTFDYAGYNLQTYALASCAAFNCILKSNSFHISVVNNNTAAAFNHCLFLNQSTATASLVTTANTNYQTATYVFLNSIFDLKNNLMGNFTYQYNIFEGSSVNITDPTNQQNVNLATVMVDYQNGDYHLCQDSPAIDAGLNGDDIGLYGGDTPFDDEWYVNKIPSITDFDCPAIVDQNGMLNVHIEAQVGN